MLSQDQLINQSLKKGLSSVKGDYIKGTSIDNLLINSSHPNITYSYFDAYTIQNKIQFCLVSIKTNTNNNHKEVIKQSLDLEPLMRVSSKDLDSIQFSIKNSKNLKELHLIEIKMKRGDIAKSNFFLFFLSQEMINPLQRLLVRQLIARKNIRQVQWHPSQHNLIVALTQNSFVIFEVEEDIDQLAQISFKELQIRQQIVDFCFWKHKSTKQHYFMSGLGISGKTYIMALKEYNKAYSINMLQIVDGYSQLNWTTLNIINVQYNRKQILLSIKSGFSYKNNKKESVMEINQFKTEDKRYHQKMIVQINGKDTISQFYFPFNIINSSLFYFYDNKVMRVDLSKPFNLITSNEKSSGHYEPQVQIIININHCQTKFVHISNGSLMTLRCKGKEFIFSTVETDILECTSQQNLVRNKINEIVAAVDKQINKPLPKDLVDPYDSIVKPNYLPEQANDAKIQNFLLEVKNFIDGSQSLITAEQMEITHLYHQINALSDQFSSLTQKKFVIQELQEQIRKNEETIRQIEESNPNRTDEQDKVELIQNMIDNLKQRPIQINQDLKKEYTGIIKKQLQVVQGIEEKMRRCSRQLEELI